MVASFLFKTRKGQKSQEILVFADQRGTFKLNLDLYRDLVSFRSDGTVILRFAGRIERRRIERMTTNGCCKEYFLSSPLKVLEMEGVRDETQKV